MADQSKSELVPCPFCGGQPWFTGDAGHWRDDSRYVDLTLECCASMTEAIGWRRARDMSVEARTEELKATLIAKWNARAAPAHVAPTDEQLAVAAYKGYDDYWTEECAGREREAWLASAKAVLSLTHTTPQEVAGAKPFPAPGAWFPVDVLGTPMRETKPGKWEVAVWPSAAAAVNPEEAS